MLTKDQIREKIRVQPDVRAAQLSEDEIEEMADYVYAQQGELVREYIEAEIRRELIRMVAKGEAEYDPETDSYRRIDK
jgi:ribosomal protein S13